MSKIRGGTQLQPDSIQDSHLKSGSMTDTLRLLMSDGDSVISRDNDGNVVQVVTTLIGGNVRTVSLTRDSNGAISSLTVTLASGMAPKTYNVFRDPNGQVTFVDEV